MKKEELAEIIKQMQDRPVLTTKAKNQIEKEMKEIYPFATVKIGTSNVGRNCFDAEYATPASTNGKQKFISVNLGSENDQKFDDRLAQGFKVLEKYNKQYKFDYQINKKCYKSDKTKFIDGVPKVLQLYGITTKGLGW